MLEVVTDARAGASAYNMGFLLDHVFLLWFPLDHELLLAPLLPKCQGRFAKHEWGVYSAKYIQSAPCCYCIWSYRNEVGILSAVDSCQRSTADHRHGSHDDVRCGYALFEVDRISDNCRTWSWSRNANGKYTLSYADFISTPQRMANSNPSRFSQSKLAWAHRRSQLA